MTTMRTISRKRRILKWAGSVAYVLLATTLILSRWWTAGWLGGTYIVVTKGGAVVVTVLDQTGRELGWKVRRNVPTSRMDWWFRRTPANLSGMSVFATPLWAPLVGIGLPTFLAWRRDRRIPPGHCASCGYDLTGNVSGRCSECGTPVPQQTTCDDGIPRSPEDENK